MPAPGDPAQHRLEVENTLRDMGKNQSYLVDAWSGLDIPVDPLTGQQMQTDKFGAIKSGMDPYAWQSQLYKKAQDNLLSKQKNEEEGLFKQFEDKLGGQEKLTDAYGRLKTQAGVPDLQKQLDVYKTEIYKVKGLLDQLDENINERTKGTFTSEAQRNRQVAAEGDPLRTSLSRLGNAAQPYMERLSSAMSEVGTMLGLTKDEQTKELEPIKLRISATTDRFAREISGFNSSKQDQLNALLNQITRGQQLEDQEWARVQQLAAEEREWAKTKEQMQLQFEYDMKKAKASGGGSNALSDILAKYATGEAIASSNGSNSAKSSALDEIMSGGAQQQQGNTVFGDWWNKLQSSPWTASPFKTAQDLYSGIKQARANNSGGGW